MSADETEVSPIAVTLAFRILGTNAVSASPQLARLAIKAPDGETVFLALNALYDIGPQALPSILVILSNANGQGRLTAMYPLASFGTNARPAIPVVIQCLDDPDEEIARGAAVVLGRLPSMKALEVKNLIPGRWKPV